MQKFPFTPEMKGRLLDVRIDELRNRLRSSDPDRLAGLTGTEFLPGDTGIGGEYRTNLWDRLVRLSYPDFRLYEVSSGAECGRSLQALVLYYFLTADGTPRGDSWISFTELPDGRFYSQAFQGYTGDVLQHEFGDDRQAFERAAIVIAGVKEDLGDAAYSFQLLPKVRLLVVCWMGDEDFPTRFQVLFNSNIGHYLPTDACAIAGSMLTNRLIDARV